MFYCLMDGHARTSTELSEVAEVSPSTASVHLNRLKIAYRVKVLVQGKHRFYSLEGPDVANALEGLSVLAGAGGSREKVRDNTPRGYAARSCYDHRAGATRYHFVIASGHSGGCQAIPNPTTTRAT